MSTITSPPPSASTPRVSVFCKTFAPDFDRFQLLLASFERYAAADLHFFVSLPRADRSAFDARFGTTRVQVLHDEDLVPQITKRGWRMQQLVKLAFARTGLADCWLWTDSDSYFIRPFSAGDFVRDGQVAFAASLRRHVLDDEEESILHYLNTAESSPVLPCSSPTSTADKRYGLSPFRQRLESLRDLIKSPSTVATLARIPEFFGRQGPQLQYMPCSIWTQESVLALEAYLHTHYRWTFSDMIAFAPWEAVWVGEWELARGAPGRFFIEPPMLHLREDQTILRARQIGLTEHKLASRYLGIQLAARHQTLTRLDPESARPST